MTSSSESTTKVQLNFYQHKGTQRLLDQLNVQAIQHRGVDMLYLPRRSDSYHALWQEDDTAFYDTAYGIPIYVKSAEGFLAQEAFMTQFGIDIKPQVVFTIARLQFENNILSEEPALIRPREGDLIYFPTNKRVFVIQYVDDKPFFYQGGKLQTYDLTCELYTYSGERFSTGIAEIDETQTDFTANSAANTDGLVTPLQINDEIEEYSNNDSNTGLIDWSANNPFSGGRF